MRIVPSTADAAIGATVEGVDLSADPSPATVDAVLDALFRHHVLVFRGQSLAPAAQVRFAKRLGQAGPPEPSRSFASHHDGLPEIQRLSFIRADGSRPADLRPSQADSWHTDYTYLPDPPELAMLAAVELPPGGPDTLWVDMQAAHASLPDARRREIGGLRAVHVQRGPLDPAVYQLPPYLRPGEADDGSALRSAVHPLVKPHPVTGRPSLYMAECYTMGVEGWPEAGGRRLVAGLYAHALRAAPVYRHVWQPGDCLLWDNRATNHRRSKPMTAPRVMHRVTIRLDPARLDPAHLDPARRPA